MYMFTRRRKVLEVGPLPRPLQSQTDLLRQLAHQTVRFVCGSTSPLEASYPGWLPESSLFKSGPDMH